MQKQLVNYCQYYCSLQREVTVNQPDEEKTCMPFQRGQHCDEISRPWWPKCRNTVKPYQDHAIFQDLGSQKFTKKSEAKNLLHVRILMRSCGESLRSQWLRTCKNLGKILLPW